MRKLFSVLFLVSFLSFAVLISIQTPSSLFIFIPLFVLIYGIFPIAGFYIKRAMAMRKLKSICKENQYKVIEKRTLHKAKVVVIVTPNKNYFITVYSVFRSYLNLIIKSETEICVERHSSSTKIYAIQPNKWHRPLPSRPVGREVENFPETYKRKNKSIRGNFYDNYGMREIESDKIIIIYPPVQNVFYQTKNFDTDCVVESMYNGCYVGSTKIYTFNGFCKLLKNLTDLDK